MATDKKAPRPHLTPPTLELEGPWRATLATEELRRSYPDNDFDDGAWTSVTVPHHWRSEPEFSATDGPLLYRTRFTSPSPFGPGADRVDEADEPRRTWLTLDGAFYTTDVWLDGSYLGDTEGYFFPHTFEISDAIAAQSEHVLGIEAACQRETDRAAKRNLTGVFQHWDLIDQDWNPGGLWQPVRLEQSGPVRIKFFRALCRDANAESATVFIRAVLDTVEARTVTIDSWLDAPAANGRASGPVHRRAHPLATGENRIEWTIEVPQPLLWWPHSLGDQPLYDLHVEVRTGGSAPPPSNFPDVDINIDINTGSDIETDEGIPDFRVDDAGDDGPDGPSLVSDTRTCRIGLRSVTMHDWVFSINGERLFLKGSNQGPTKMALAEASPDDFERDIRLAKEAGLDFLRVHAHVSRLEFYEAADEAGLLLWQDMPLQWGYHRSIRKQARRQARELVDRLAHHPSVFVWCGHNEPMALDIEPAALTDPRLRAKIIIRMARSQMLPTWNKSVLDYSIKRVIEKTDGSRPVVPHSGIFPHLPQLEGTDTHSYFGWYHGNERDFAPVMRHWPRLARFVSEFGAQAIPNDASFLEPERWPDLDWDRAYRKHALQKVFMDRHVPPGDYQTFEEWQIATQRYQAQVITSHIEVLRRIKYQPCGGFAQFNFADGYPSATWSVLGHDRAPKLGYDALAAACRPVIVVADRLPATLRPGSDLATDIHVVSDSHIALSDMLVTAHLSWGESDAGQEWRWQGEVAPDQCVRVGTLRATVPAVAGQVVLKLSLDGRGIEGPVTNYYESTIVSR